MRFTAALSTLLLGASLTSSVFAVPTAPSLDTHLERRDFQNLDDDIEADKETWDAAFKHCGGGSSKRDFSKRAPSMNVKMGDSDMMNFPIGLDTNGLLSCLGVVITGQTEDGKSFRVLGHFTASMGGMESQWQKFKSKYDGAGKIDKDSTRGYMSVPDYDKEYEEGQSGFYGKHGEKNKPLIDLAKEFEGELRDRVDSLVNNNPQRIPRDPDSAATMEVTDNNEVKVNGNPV